MYDRTCCDDPDERLDQTSDASITKCAQSSWWFWQRMIIGIQFNNVAFYALEIYTRAKQLVGFLHSKVRAT